MILIKLRSLFVQIFSEIYIRKIIVMFLTKRRIYTKTNYVEIIFNYM